MACLFVQARRRLHRQRQQFKPLLMWRCNLPAGQQDPLRYAFHSIFFKSIATLADAMAECGNTIHVAAQTSITTTLHLHTASVEKKSSG